jgi:hypothetical protein
MNLNALTENDIRAAARRVHDESKVLLAQFNLQREGTRVYWVFDANIAHLYFDPHHHADYASPVHVSSARGKKAQVGTSAETALAWVLADFLFGERFALNQPASRKVDSAVGSHRIVLEPHSTELHEAFAAIRRKSLGLASGAVNAVSDSSGAFQSKLRQVIDAFRRKPQDDARPYVAQVQRLLRQHLPILLPDGPAAELRRAKELLERNTLLYEADVPWLVDELASENATDRVFELTDDWYERLVEAATRSAGGSTKSSNPELETLRHAQNDAIALAKLQYLNESVHGDGSPRRFVFVTAHGLIHRAVRESRVASVIVLRPSVFLGSKYLFPLREAHEEEAARTGQWVRLTNSLELLHETGGRHRPYEAQKTGDDDSQPLARFKKDWNALLGFALPFLPAHASGEEFQALADELLQGNSLRAFERTLYSALGDLLVLSSEMSLDDGFNTSDSSLAPTPVLRLAFYPRAEDCILRLSRLDASVEGAPDARRLIEQVRDEQHRTSVSDFNYPLLICLACWFVSLGRLRLARALVGHARGVVEVTTQAAPLVTGREAAFLECYVRRLQARHLDDVDQAEAALRFFRNAVGEEELQWTARLHAPSLAMTGAPREEFSIHRWRADLQDKSISLLRLALPHFTGAQRSNFAIAAGLRPVSRKIGDILRALVIEIKRPDVAAFIQAQDLAILRSLREFSICDAVITAAKCMLLIAGGNPGRGRLGHLTELYEVLRMTSDSLSEPLVRFTAPYVELLTCIWGKQNGRATMLNDGIGANSRDTDPGTRMRGFLLWVAMQTRSVEN